MITNKYQFPKITEKMYNEIKTWHETHNDGRCADVCGTAGDDVVFEICPTAIGDFITVQCHCGAELHFDEV